MKFIKNSVCTPILKNAVNSNRSFTQLKKLLPAGCKLNLDMYTKKFQLKAKYAKKAAETKVLKGEEEEIQEEFYLDSQSESDEENDESEMEDVEINGTGGQKFSDCDVTVDVGRAANETNAERDLKPLTEFEFFERAWLSQHDHLNMDCYIELKAYSKKVYLQHKNDPRQNDPSQKHQFFSEMYKTIEDLHDRDQVMPAVEEIDLDFDHAPIDFFKAVVHSVKKPFRIGDYVMHWCHTQLMHSKHKNDGRLKDGRLRYGRSARTELLNGCYWMLVKYQ